MFTRIAKFRKGEAYEDLDRVEMDITDPAMRNYAGITTDGEVQHHGDTVAEVREEPPEGNISYPLIVRRTTLHLQGYTTGLFHLDKKNQHVN